MFAFILLSLINFSFALEVVKFEKLDKIELKIVRADPESFETYSLMNHNGREMILVCAKNRVYDDNPRAFIEYRNYYNEIVGNFTLESNQVCLDMGKFIENIHLAINEDHPFMITLDPKSMKVEKIVYPKVNPFTDKGEEKDLLPVRPIEIKAIKKPEMM